MIHIWGISNKLNKLSYEPTRDKIGEFTPQKIWSNYTKIKKNQERKVEVYSLDINEIKILWDIPKSIGAEENWVQKKEEHVKETKENKTLSENNKSYKIIKYMDIYNTCCSAKRMFVYIC